MALTIEPSACRRRVGDPDPAVPAGSATVRAARWARWDRRGARAARRGPRPAPPPGTAATVLIIRAAGSTGCDGELLLGDRGCAHRQRADYGAGCQKFHCILPIAARGTAWFLSSAGLPVATPAALPLHGR